MAEMVEEKTTGLKFAEKQLLRHGWEKGKGLGKSENGISEAIKVKIKSGKGGMGHKEGEQFSFHWWDHVFNKASSSLVVESGQSGVMVKSHDGSDGLISNKKPRKAQQAKSMLYGCFVKSATLLSGEEQPEKASDSDDSSSSSSEDEDQKLDLSSTTKLSDADLLKACGGRTAHKGARHGLTMCAKLARLEQQEQEFMNKYGKKNHNAATSTSNMDCLNPDRHPDIEEQTKRKKSKRQKESLENNIYEVRQDTENDSPENTEPQKRKKRNRKEKEAPEVNEEGETHLPINDSMKKKKKKKKQSEVVSGTADTDEISEDSIDSKKKKTLEGSIEHQQPTDTIFKRKKKKKSKDHKTSPSTDVDSLCSLMTVAEDTSNEAQVMDTQTEGQENNRKKKKKKRSKNEEQEDVENEESVPKKKKKKEQSC